MLKTVPAARCKLPRAAPPPERFRVPDSRSTSPALRRGMPIVEVLEPSSTSRTPWLLNRDAGLAKKLPRDAPSCSVKRLPGRLFHAASPRKSKPLLTAVAVPQLSTVRSTSMEKKPPLSVAWLVLSNTVWPVPAIEPLVQVH